MHRSCSCSSCHWDQPQAVFFCFFGGGLGNDSFRLQTKKLPSDIRSTSYDASRFLSLCDNPYFGTSKYNFMAVFLYIFLLIDCTPILKNIIKALLLGSSWHNSPLLLFFCVCVVRVFFFVSQRIRRFATVWRKFLRAQRTSLWPEEPKRSRIFPSASLGQSGVDG